MTICLALIDDDGLFRKGLRTVLEGLDAEVRIKEFACVPSDSFSQSDFAAQLVLLDYHIPDTEFAHNLSAVHALFPNARVTVLSADDNPHHILAVLDQGADGFIPKSSNSAMLIAALKLILLGQTYLPAQVLLLATHTTPSLRRNFARLSHAQQRVLLDVVAGKSNKMIAFELGLALGTIKSHLSAAYTVLGLRNRTEAVIALNGFKPSVCYPLIEPVWNPPNATEVTRKVKP